QVVKQDELDAVIKHSLQGRTNKQVILRGDKNSKLDLTIKVMDAARKSGAESLDIITDQP
ncbi:MAG: biopolymer transporter ExbD, partial [Gammaproteobacteria bacterium]|nr:biopolymer transporter ExbD [Gammaproteobacteria bacterium]